ncbi:MAG: BON domain-containing protein [Mariprofundaceae bacterium]
MSYEQRQATAQYGGYALEQTSAKRQAPDDPFTGHILLAYCLRARQMKNLLFLLIALLCSGCIATTIATTTAITGAAHDERSLGANLDDTTLSTSMMARLIAEKDMPSRWLSIEVIYGEVTLFGYLPTQEQIDRAIFICNSFANTRAIHNKIILGKPRLSELISDSWITTKVKLRLLDDPITKGSSIHVETVQGRVYLQGVVNNEEERYHAITLAQKLKGVKSVKNLMTFSLLKKNVPNNSEQATAPSKVTPTLDAPDFQAAPLQKKTHGK